MRGWKVLPVGDALEMDQVSFFFMAIHKLYLLRIDRLYRCPVLVQNKVILFDFLCYNNYLLQGQSMKPSVC